MTSSTEPEVDNIFHCRTSSLEPRSQVACIKKFVKFGHVVFEICEQTDRHTNTLSTTLRTLAASEVNTHRLINNDDSPALFGVGESVPGNAIQTTETQ